MKWIAAILTLILVCYLTIFNYVKSTEVGLAFNRISGNLWLQNPGVHITEPWVFVSNVDVRPKRVCIDNDGRGVNCKLVRFVASEYSRFVEAEGHRYYWLSNRISFNIDHKREYRGMDDLLRGYAFSTKKYSFVEILSEGE